MARAISKRERNARLLGVAVALAVTAAACRTICWPTPAIAAATPRPVTEANNRIELPWYTLTVPPDAGWLADTDGAPEGKIVLTRQRDERVFMVNVLVVPILDPEVQGWKAERVADDYMQAERNIMMEQGVKPGLYELKDVKIGSETHGRNHFHTMTYTTQNPRFVTRAGLYLLFPKPEGNEWFLAVQWNEATPPGMELAEGWDRELNSLLRALALAPSREAAAKWASLDEYVGSLRQESLSAEAFRRAEARLRKLETGDALSPDMLWEFFMATGPPGEMAMVTGDGWFQSMSGGTLGATSGLGEVYARTQSAVRGQHVFGWVPGIREGHPMLQAPFLPVYLLQTEARIIDKPEYARLEKLRRQGIGEFRWPGSDRDSYFADLRVLGVRRLPSADLLGASPDDEIGLRGIPDRDVEQRLSGMMDVYSKASFQEAKQALEAFAPGTNEWEICARLNASWLTGFGGRWDYGTGYARLMKGYANYDKDRKWWKTTATAV